LISSITLSALDSFFLGTTTFGVDRFTGATLAGAVLTGAFLVTI
jgi:hypothetical protein